MGNYDTEVDVRILTDALLRQAGWDPAERSQVRTEALMFGVPALRGVPGGTGGGEAVEGL